MADTSQAEQPQTNGVNACDDEDERGKMRPADIDADMREMERRKRVELIMNSRLFREELERIIETQMKDGGAGTSGLLQQISDMMGIPKHSGNMFKQSNCVVPINDIRGIESMGYAKGEKFLRCKHAAVFRLMDLYGWSQGINNQITTRLNQDLEHFLINPYGMLYHEITASSLVKIDMQGNVVEQGTTNFGVNLSEFCLHAAIHAARPDIKCIIHIHVPSVIAVSALKNGLLPLSQESIVIGEVTVHPFRGLATIEQRELLARDLGPISKVLFLTNHGAVCCGETVEEAFYNVYNTILACETQMKLISVGSENCVFMTENTQKEVGDAACCAPEGALRNDHPAILPDKLERKWRIGGMEFEALMRMLDNAGFRTGYIYRHPLVKGDPPRPRNDVEVPPAVSSLGYLLEEEEMYKQGIWKPGRKGNDRTRWLNSPNVYQKVEILETGTPDPKKITKWVDANADEWVADGSPTHSSTPVKIDAALQFVPKNTNPKEFKQLQQQIKDNRRADKISAGPQSHILEGVTWEEARKMQDATVTQTGDQVVLLGAASKGIIQRGYQHHATVYKAPYAKNPFDSVTDEELDEYKKVIERKARGEYDTDFSESEGLSSAQISKRTENNMRSPQSATSETEEESRDDHQVVCIETKQAPKPSQPEVVLSDGARGLTINMHKQEELLTCYRTESHAGMPRGSYLNPNPKHFHISHSTTPLAINVNNASFKTCETQSKPLPKYSPRLTTETEGCLYLAANNKFLKLGISLQVVKEFIEPFNEALHSTVSVACQTETDSENSLLMGVHSRLMSDINLDNYEDPYIDMDSYTSLEENLEPDPDMKLFSRCNSSGEEITVLESANVDSGLCEEINTVRDLNNITPFFDGKISNSEVNDDTKEMGVEKDTTNNNLFWDNKDDENKLNELSDSLFASKKCFVELEEQPMETVKSKSEIKLLNVDAELSSLNIDVDANELESSKCKKPEDDGADFLITDTLKLNLNANFNNYDVMKNYLNELIYGISDSLFSSENTVTTITEIEESNMSSTELNINNSPDSLANTLSHRETPSSSQNNSKPVQCVLQPNIISELQDVTNNLRSTSDDLKNLSSDIKTSLVDLKSVSEDFKRAVNNEHCVSGFNVEEHMDSKFNENLDARLQALVPLECSSGACNFDKNDDDYQQFTKNLNNYLELYTTKFSSLSSMFTAAIFDFITAIYVETFDTLELPDIRCYHGAPHFFDVLLKIFQPFSCYFDKQNKRYKLIKKIQYSLMRKMKNEVLVFGTPEDEFVEKILQEKLLIIKKFTSVIMYIHFSNFDWPDIQCTHNTTLESDFEFSFQSLSDLSTNCNSDEDEDVVRKPGDGASDVYNLYDKIHTVRTDDSTMGFLQEQDDRNLKYWVTIDSKNAKRAKSCSFSQDTNIFDKQHRFSLPTLSLKRPLSPIVEEPVKMLTFHEFDSENETSSKNSYAELNFVKCETLAQETKKVDDPLPRRIYYERDVIFLRENTPKDLQSFISSISDNTLNDVPSEILTSTETCDEFNLDCDLSLTDSDWMGYEAAKF